MQNEIKELAAVKKNCHTTGAVIRGIAVLLLVCMILCLVGSGICYFLRGEINAGFAADPTLAENIHVDVDFMGMDATDEILEVMDRGYYGEFFATMALVAAVAIAIVFAIMRSIAGVFSTIEKNDSPFTPVVLMKVRKVFILLAVLCLLGEGLGDAILLGLVLWCVYSILRYGCVLQQQADETL